MSSTNPASVQNATVVSIQGKAYLQTSDGQRIALHPGTQIIAGQEIVVDPRGQVQLKLANGQMLELGGGRTILADDEMLSQAPVDKSEAALTLPQLDAERVIQALNTGTDPFDVLDPAAAGLAGGGSDNGHSFVQLLRIVENIDPQTLLSTSEYLAPDLQLPTGATIASTDTTGELPTITIGNITVNEGAGTATFVLTLSAPSSQVITVSYNTTGGTATSNTDFSATTGTVSFAPGSTSATISVPIANDSVFEGPEGFTVNLSAPSNATLGSSAGQGTIVDDGTGSGGSDNDTPRITTVSNPTVTEGDNLDFVVTLSNASSTPTAVSLSLISGTASLGIDTATGVLVSVDGGASFSPLTGTVANLPVGTTSLIVRVPSVDDSLIESTESFTLSASTSANTTPVVATGTIVDNDVAQPRITTIEPGSLGASDDAVVEGNTLVFNVSLSAVTTAPSTYTFSLGGGTAATGVDFSAAPSFTQGVTYDSATGRITVPAGVSTFAVAVPTLDDSVIEATETVPLAIGGVSATGLIIDNDTITPPPPPPPATPTLSITGPATIDEAAGTATYTVTLSNPSATPVTVAYGTANGTATAGSDYTATSGSLSFAPGATVATFTVPVTNDALYEGSENFSVSLSSPTGATIATGLGSVSSSIVDDGSAGPDDDRPAVGAVSSPSITEGGNLDFTVTLTHPSTTPTTVTLTLAAGSTNPATLGTDTNPALVSTDGGTNWVALTPTVSVPAGSTSLLVRVPTVNDLVSEPTETVSLSAATAQNTTPVAGTGSILDNDGAPPCRSPARPRLMRRPAPSPIRSPCPIRRPPRSPSPMAPPMARPSPAATTPPPAVR
ncbi:MAG: retention module-containing protein [Uliginosibacterium sp.]|nr:retention module-containing protein [Uliginosibacterium sp.]